jgi:hypothetical protein
VLARQRLEDVGDRRSERTAEAQGPRPKRSGRDIQCAGDVPIPVTLSKCAEENPIRVSDASLDVAQHSTGVQRGCRIVCRCFVFADSAHEAEEARPMPVLAGAAANGALKVFRRADAVEHPVQACLESPCVFVYASPTFQRFLEARVSAPGVWRYFHRATPFFVRTAVGPLVS